MIAPLANGLRFSYDSDEGVYVFGQWNQLISTGCPEAITSMASGIGAHQAFNEQTSFYIDAGVPAATSWTRRLDGASDNYWRVNYGLRSRSAA